MGGTSGEPDFLRGGGELGALLRVHDWSATPLGPPAGWPRSLKTAIRIMLTSRQPIWVGWGPQLTYFYNDAYKSIIGGKHPWALGRPTLEVWAEIRDDIEPMLATAMRGDEGTYVEEQLLIMERSGYPEETYYTFSYSPIPDDEGGAGGIICANAEDTGGVIGERQLALLRELGARTADARTMAETCAGIATALAANPRDITFALLYVAGAEPHGPAAESAGASPGPVLAASAGIAADHPAVARAWPVPPPGAAARLVPLEPDAAAPWPGGAWDQPAVRAAVLPIAAGEQGASGTLLVGLNPFRLFDDSYRGFLELAAGQIAAALANAEAYEAERQRAEALAELDRAKTAFFSNVSHEFRTPLTLMLGPLEEVLAKGEGGVLPDNRALVTVAHRNGLRLMKLVNALLDFSRIEAGRVEARFRRTDLAAFTADLASSFRSATEKAGLALAVDCPPLAHPAWVDREMWEKIVLNLVSNAFKFTMAGTIAVGLAEDGGDFVLTVRDTGIGIPAHELPRLFERFHRVEGAAGRTFEGSGIGLALVQELVRLHGGTVAVASTPGEGSTFTVRIPASADHLDPGQVVPEPETAPASRRAEAFVEEALRWLPDDAQPPIPAPAALAIVPATTPEPRPRIVLADDNADMRDYVRRLLAPRYDVVAVADGEAAWAAIADSRPDLLLTDVMMPVLDGFGLLARIRADAALRDLPVVMLSARAGEEARVDGIEAGADDYLVKPFSAREMIARVSTNLELARSRRRAEEALRALNEQLAEETARLSRMFEEAPSMMALLRGPDHVFELANPAYLALVGRRDLVGRPLAEAIPEIVQQGFVELLDEVRATGRPHVGQGRPARLARVPGLPLDERLLDFVYQPLLGPDGAVDRIFVQATDVTERVRAETLLRELNQKLEARVAAAIAEREAAEEALRQAQKMEAVGQLTGGIAHDFNNLLTIITGNLDMSLRLLESGRGHADGAARLRRAIGNALKGADRAASLTQRLLAFSRRQPLAPRALDVDRLIREMSDLFLRTLGEQVRLEVATTPGLWQVEADPHQLESALINLAVNARDAMPGGGTLRIATSNVELTAAQAAALPEAVPGSFVVIAVADSGTGMSPDVRARAFEPFFTTKEIGKGTGLGLSMVYGFVRQSGGHVAIDAPEAGGTVIRIYLPRLAVELPEPIAAEAIADLPRGHGETILVVEDDDDVRAYTVEILRELGYGVIEAADGEGALAALEAHAEDRVDLLFADMVMPGMSGRELALHAHRRLPGLRVLYTSGYTGDGSPEDLGIALLPKPFTFAALADAVRTALAAPST